MKKISLYTLFGMLCMFMTACDEDFEDWADPQTWPEEEAVTVPGFTASAVEGTVNMKDVAEDSVKLFSLNNDADAQVENVRISLKASEVAEAAPVKFLSDNNGKVAKAELVKFLEDNYGKRPVERVLAGNVYADVMINGQAMFVNAGEIMVTIVPEAPVIENNYYLCGDVCGWDTGKSLKFNHSDKDVYEDPVFTLVFDVEKADSYWKILIENENGTPDWPGQIGVAENGDASLSGKLIQKVGDMPDPGAGRFEKPGKYIMTINMMDYTYEIKPMVSDYYFLVGALQGWNANADGKTCMFYPENAIEMSYTTKWTGDGNFKFWKGSEFGNWDVAFGSEIDMSREMTGKVVNAGAGAIAVPEMDMFYTVRVNTAAMTYEWIKLDNQEPKEYSQISLIGEFNSWAGDTDLKQVAPHNWTVEFEQKADGQLKIRANHDWADSWGAEEGLDITKTNYFDSKYNGANINVPAGTYNIYFNDITAQLVFVKK